MHQAAEEPRRWRLITALVLTWLGTFALPGWLLLGPYGLWSVADFTVPIALVLGTLGAFERSRRLALWLFRGLVFIIGWFCGLALALPAFEGDKAFALEVARVIWLLSFFVALAPFGAVGVVLLIIRRTRGWGLRVLASLLLLPTGTLLAWYVGTQLVPEWSYPASRLHHPPHTAHYQLGRHAKRAVPDNNRMKLTSGDLLAGWARRWQDGGARGFIESPLAAYPGVIPTLGTWERTVVTEGFALEEYWSRRPYVFHTLLRVNLPGLRMSRSLLSVAEMRVLAPSVPGLLGRRQTRVRAVLPFGPVEVQDQGPLHPGNIAFEGGWGLPDLLTELDRRVFFWSGDAQGPVDHGRRHFQRYQREAVLLRIPFKELYEAADPKPEVCKFNSGSPRCFAGRKSPRGPTTFVPYAEAVFGAQEVVEVTFRRAVTLPESTRLGDHIEGPWRALRANARVGAG